MYCKILFLILCTQTSFFLSAQNIGIGTATPDPSAKLHIVDVNRGLLVPKISIVDISFPNPVTAPATGLLVWNTNATVVGGSGTGFYYWNGTEWVALGTGSSNAWELMGNTGTTNGVNFLGTTDAQDIDIRTNNVLRARLTQKSQLEILNSGASIFIGEQAGENDDLSANQNIYIGHQAGFSSTVGYNNVAIGYHSGENLTTARLNTFVGHQSGQANTTGISNIFIGSSAGLVNTTGLQNTYIGGFSGSNNISGGQNTFIGFQSGWFNTASGNTFMGTQSGARNTTGDANCYLGYFSGYNNTTARRNVYLGYESGRDGMTGNDNVYLGYRSARYATSSQNVAIGFESMGGRNAGGARNFFSSVAIGYRSMVSAETGSQNVAVGHRTLEENASSNNTAIGFQAMRDNTRSNANTALGSSALGIMSFDNGGSIYNGYNTAIGFNALNQNQPTTNNNANYNTALGARALEDNTQGIGNTATGYRATRYLTTGDYNISMGYETGEALTIGNRNTIIGYHANMSAGTFSNAMALGADAVTDGNNRVRIGATTVTSIGGQVGWTTFSDKRFKKDINDNDIVGLDFIMKLKPVSYRYNVSNIDKFHQVSDSVLSTRDYSSIKNKRFVGLMAQDVAEVAQDVGFISFSGVDEPSDSDYGTYGIRYAEFVIPLIKAVQEQQIQIEILKEQNELLLEKINSNKE